MARRRDAVPGLRHARRDVGYRWYLWVFHSREVVISILAAGRSHDVPEEHLGPVEEPGIMVVDRYKAYQAVDKVKSGLIVLAFCWARVRRDFLARRESAGSRSLGDGLGGTDRQMYDSMINVSRCATTRPLLRRPMGCCA